MSAYVVAVSFVDGGRAAFRFDQERVVVGRGRASDLRVEHAAVSRAQFAIERVAGRAGEAARFRIVPLGGANRTTVNGQPAVEGSLAVGDVIAVSAVRFVLERGRAPAGDAGAQRTRVVKLAGAAVALVVIAALWLSGPAAATGAQASGERLFRPLAVPQCFSADACSERAHEAYAKGRRYIEQAASEPGSWYRAALEFARAVQFAAQSRRPLADIADAREQLERAVERAQLLYEDARFQLGRATASRDRARVLAAVVAVERVVPDASHPIRRALVELRRAQEEAK
jgi:hypothetical protein